MEIDSGNFKIYLLLSSCFELTQSSEMPAAFSPDR